MNEWIKIGNRVIEIEGLLLDTDREYIDTIKETEKDIVSATLDIEIYLLRKDYVIVEKDKGSAEHV